MASSSSDPYNQEFAIRQRKKSSPLKFLVPLIYAPVLPLIRVTFRHKPVLRDRLFFGVLAGAFVHGAYLVHMHTKGLPAGLFALMLELPLLYGISDLYDAESK